MGPSGIRVVCMGFFVQGATALSPGCSAVLSATDVMVSWAACFGSPLLRMQLLALAVVLSLLVFAAVQTQRRFSSAFFTAQFRSASVGCV